MRSAQAQETKLIPEKLEDLNREELLELVRGHWMLFPLNDLLDARISVADKKWHALDEQTNTLWERYMEVNKSGYSIASRGLYEEYLKQEARARSAWNRLQKLWDWRNKNWKEKHVNNVAAPCPGLLRRVGERSARKEQCKK